MSAYAYAEGLKAIELMYLAARETLRQHFRELDDNTREYHRHLDAGHSPIGLWDDEGERLWEQDQVDRLEQMAAEDALFELRSATGIMIYHHWEKHVPNVSRRKRRNHSELAQDAESAGIPLHADINVLCYVANYLKHGNAGGWLEKLAPMRETRIEPGQSRATNAHHLRLSDDDVMWLFEIAKASRRPIIREAPST